MIDEMEAKQHAPSVIARLMGLAELPPQQQIHKQRRALSESYLQKTASVGLREKSSFSVDRVPSINLDSRASKDNVLGVKEPNSFNVQISASYCSAGRSVRCKSAIASKYRSNEMCKGSHELTTQRDIFKSLQKVGTGSSRGPFQQHDKNHFELKPNMHHPSTRIVLLRSSSKKLQNPQSDVEPSRQSFRVPMATGSPKRTIQHVRRALINNSKVTSGQGGAVIKPCMQPSKALSPSSSSYSNITVLGHTSDSNGSFFAKEAKKQNFEQWKMTKNFQEVEVARRSRTLGEMLATADLETQPGYLDSKNEKHDCFVSFSHHRDKQGSGYPLGISSKDGWKDELIRASPRSKSFNNCSTVSGNSKSKIRTETSQYSWCLWQKEGNAQVKDDNKFRKHNKKYYVEFEGEREMILEKRNMSKFSKCSSGLSYSPSKGLASTRNVVLANTNNENIESSCMIFKGLQSEPTLCSLSREDSHSSCIRDAAVRQESLKESHNNRLVSSKDTRIDGDSLRNLKEANQTSPISVLEPPLKEEKLPRTECFDSPIADLHDLVLHLQLHESNSWETYSEGSEMAVSSDEDTIKGSVDLSQDGEYLLGVFRADESRDYSYLVDVLDESPMILELDIETWHSLECPISPSVFETLEKKYSKHTSWPKLGRRLLFDRINARLSEILNSFMDIHLQAKSLKTRFDVTLRRNVVEEKLWMLLVDEEKEVDKSLPQKALETETKWLELEGEISTICREIENYLFEELALELDCIESF